MGRSCPAVSLLRAGQKQASQSKSCYTMTLANEHPQNSRRTKLSGISYFFPMQGIFVPHIRVGLRKNMWGSEGHGSPRSSACMHQEAAKTNSLSLSGRIPSEMTPCDDAFVDNAGAWLAAIWCMIDCWPCSPRKVLYATDVPTDIICQWHPLGLAFFQKRSCLAAAEHLYASQRGHWSAARGATQPPPVGHWRLQPVRYLHVL